MPVDPLFAPLTIKHLTIKNRLMTTAHEPNYAEQGMPSERYIRYHEARAEGGIGMTMTAGSAVVSADSPPAFGNLHLHKDEIVPHLRRLCDRCHAHGSAVMIQITHLGRRSRWDEGDWLPLLSASSVREPAHRAFPKAAEDWDLDRIVSDYLSAAERVQAAGLDGIELETYGHFLDSFWSHANRREDEHGGSLENRLRFSRRLVRALRQKLGENFVLGARLSLEEGGEDGFSNHTGLDIARALVAEGLDFLNIIRGRIDSDANLSKVIPSFGMRATPHLEFVGAMRKALGVAVFHAARIATLADARYAVREGKVDMVGMTRAHIADPNLAHKAQAGREEDIRPCVGASYCIDRLYLGQDALCLHNAATGREQFMPHEIARKKRKHGQSRPRVVIVGAGPAGLEAARVCAARGLATIVLEAGAVAGGQLRLFARGRRSELLGIVDWREQQIAKFGGEIRYHCFAEREEVLSHRPDIVLIATGGVPQKPALSFGEDCVRLGWDVLSGGDRVAAGSRVVLYDANGAHSGLQIAEALGAMGCEVLFVTPERALAPDVGGLGHASSARVFFQHKIRVEINTRLIGVARRGNRLEAVLGSDYADYEEALGAPSPSAETLRARVRREIVDHVFVDHACAPVDDLYHDLKALSRNGGAVDYAALLSGEPQSVVRNRDGQFRLFRVGDAVASRNVHAAIYDSLRMCKDF